MPRRRKRQRRDLSPAHAAARRKLREGLSERARALHSWLTDQLDGDGATAHLVWWVGTLHAGLRAWTADATRAHVLPLACGTGSVAGTSDPDRALDRALAQDLDAEDLEHVRALVVGKAAELVSWYQGHGADQMWISPELLDRLARWTRDDELAVHLATCITAHTRLRRVMPQSRAAEAAWRRLVRSYLRLLDGGSGTR